MAVGAVRRTASFVQPCGSCKKGAFDRLLAATFDRARERGLLEEKPEAAIEVRMRVLTHNLMLLAAVA